MVKRVLAGLFLVLALACNQTADPEPAPTAEPTEEATAQPSPQAETVTIYLHSGNPNDCAEVVPVERETGGRPTLFTGMQQLMFGPTDEEKAQGLGGWFSEDTRDYLISAERDGDVARVDFKDLREVIPNASSSCGSATLLAQLDSTARQFGSSKTLYSINGDLDTFYEWLQMSTPEA
jgi:hypothetical protein